MDAKFFAVLVGAVLVFCSPSTKPVDENQISAIQFNGYSKYRTITTRSDTSLIDTTITIQTVVSDSIDPMENEIITVKDSVNGFSFLSKYLQNKNGIFLLESVSPPVFTKRKSSPIIFDRFPVIIYGLKQNSDSNYQYKNNINDLISGSQRFLGNQTMTVNNYPYRCSAVKNSIVFDSTCYSHTIYYSTRGLIKKEQIDTMEMTIISDSDRIVPYKKVAFSYFTELLESR